MSKRKYETIEVRLNTRQLEFVNRIAKEAYVSPEEAIAVMLALYIREQEPVKPTSTTTQRGVT